MTFADFRRFEQHSEGRVAAFVLKDAKHGRPDVQIVCQGDDDPLGLAMRHQWAAGTLVTGRALFVPIPSTTPWTPSVFPRDASQLETLVSRCLGEDQALASWLLRVAPKLRGRKRGAKGTSSLQHKHPLLVVLVQDNVLYGYQVFPTGIPILASAPIQPFTVTRIDANWALSRDHAPDQFEGRKAKRVLLLGAGSLGAPVAELIARAGVGTLDIVDPQLLDSPNVGRHTLGMTDLRQGKAKALAAKLTAEIPGVVATGHMTTASKWLSKCSPGMYDLVVDCTAESSVRTTLTRIRETQLGLCPVIHAWVEPFCCAAHVLLSQPSDPYPADDPADELVNAADFGNAKTDVDIPACGDGFHPYGPADIVQAAGFTAIRVLTVVDNLKHPSTIWSKIRAAAFFEGLELPVMVRSWAARDGGPLDANEFTRDYRAVLLRE